MFCRLLFLLLVFCTLTSSAQEIDMSTFSKKVKVIENKIPLSEIRESQKGFLFSYSLSFGPWSGDYKVMYIKESFIPFGIYTGFGRTQVFTNSANFNSYNQEDGIYSGDNYWQEGYLPVSYSDYKQHFGPANSYYYYSIGLSKNLTESHTIYAGYARIAMEREGEYFPFVKW